MTSSRQPDASAHAYHQAGGRFRNPWPASQPQGARGLLKWMMSRRRQPVSDHPPASSVPVATAPDAANARLAITWIGHSTFLIQAGGSSVLTDPICSDRASPVRFAGPRRHSPPGLSFDALPAINAVVLSHDHYDHLDSMTVRRLATRYPDAQWIAPVGVGALLRRRGAANVAELDWWQSRTFGRMSVDCT